MPHVPSTSMGPICIKNSRNREISRPDVAPKSYSTSKKNPSHDNNQHLTVGQNLDQLTCITYRKFQDPHTRPPIPIVTVVVCACGHYSDGCYHGFPYIIHLLVPSP